MTVLPVLVCLAILERRPRQLCLQAWRLAVTVGDLTLRFVSAASTLTQDTVTNFTFSSSGLLFIDNAQAATQPYLCGGNTSEINWFDATNDLTYDYQR